MKKIVSLLLLSLVFLNVAPVQSFESSFGTSCQPYCEPVCEPQCGNGWFDFSTTNVVARYSAFFPFSSRVTKIYDDALPCLELEANVNVYDNWVGFVNAGYIWDEGRSIGLSDRTELNLVPVSLGLKYLFCFSDCMDAYLGAGLLAAHLNTHDHSRYVREHTNKWMYGGVVKTGFYYYYSDCIFFEGFLDYMGLQHHFKDRRNDGRFVEGNHVDLSGMKLGFGVGMKF